MSGTFASPAAYRSNILSRRISLSLVQAVVILMAAILAAGAGGYFVHMKLTPAAVPAVANAVTRLPIRTFGHWNLVCVQGATKKCEILLRVVNQTSRKPVLNIALGQSRDRQTVLVIITPPNAAAKEGVLVAVADNPAHVASLTCGSGACRALMPAGDDLQKELASSNRLRINYKTSDGRPMSYELPNDGFAQAIAAWKQSV